MAIIEEGTPFFDFDVGRPLGTHVEPILGHLGPILGPSWALLGLSWAHLGPILGPSWAILGHLGAILGHLGPSWITFSMQRDTFGRKLAIRKPLSLIMCRAFCILEPQR